MTSYNLAPAVCVKVAVVWEIGHVAAAHALGEETTELQ